MEQGAAAAARIPRVLPKSAWINDKDVPECQGPDCTLLFSAVKRRHHCRYCGRIFCEKCSRWKVVGQRSCLRCFNSASEGLRAAENTAGPFEAYSLAATVSPAGANTSMAHNCGGEGALADELTLAKGVAVRVRVWVNTNWVIVTALGDESVTGLVPTAYLVMTPELYQLLQLCHARRAQLQSIDKLIERRTGEASRKKVVSALCDIGSENEIELTLFLGEAVTLHQWVDASWLVATKDDGTAGIVPAPLLTPHPATILPRAVVES
eukprot:m.106015 g.106015  ORF g.106015 m.106015 type:complete len:266 (-) comp12681_c0_seq1:36-833(-)